jgi:hypothetical protein
LKPLIHNIQFQASFNNNKKARENVFSLVNKTAAAKPKQ